MALAVLSLLLAALLGFAVHRGSVCMVRGVAEVVSTGRARMLLSFAKAAVWVLIVTTLISWLAPSLRPLAYGWAWSGYALVGGFLFGVGAAVNRGCTFSTLGRLGNGDIGAWFTLGGFALGAWSYASATTLSIRAQPKALPATLRPARSHRKRSVCRVRFMGALGRVSTYGDLVPPDRLGRNWL